MDRVEGGHGAGTSRQVRLVSRRVRAVVPCPARPRFGLSRSMRARARSWPVPMASPFRVRSARRECFSVGPASGWRSPRVSSVGCSVRATRGCPPMTSSSATGTAISGSSDQQARWSTRLGPGRWATGHRPRRARHPGDRLVPAGRHRARRPGAANGRTTHLDPRSRHGRVRAADQGSAGWAGVTDRVENDDDDNGAPDTGEKGLTLTASLALSDRVHTAPHAGPHDVRASGATKLNSRPPTLRI